ncbi:MAG: hypothetical protein Q8Q24_01665 [bacterium]|nr:hypothetical protein [bacterium]
MIISRAPVRITFGGGGTDLPSYYTKYGGFLLAATINKYVYVIAHKSFKPIIRLSYIDTETADYAYQIKHDISRESFRLLGIKNGWEIVSLADVPSGTGLGSSGAFGVALLNALHAGKKEKTTPAQLAEEACLVEIEKLKAPVGKQDQYMTAFGGLTCLTIGKDGQVKVEPLKLKEKDILRLEENIVLFYTGRERKSATILEEEDKRNKENDPKSIEALHLLKKIAFKTKQILESGHLDHFGELLNLHWQTKKKLSKKVSDPFLDECYETGLKHGATGGKIMGAGGGGFFLFYHPVGDRSKLVQAMAKMGLPLIPFKFDFQGAKIVANL